MLSRFLLASLALILAACGQPPAQTPPATAPSVAASATPSAELAPPPLPEPLKVGSKEVQDDLYCAGLVNAAYPQPDQALVPVEYAKIMQMQDQVLALRVEGIGRLVDEKVALITQAGGVADAWDDVAHKEFAAKTLRIPLKTCEARSMDAMKRALKAQ